MSRLLPLLILVACSAKYDRPTDVAPATIAAGDRAARRIVVVPTGGLYGLSGLAHAHGSDLWAVPERDHVLLRYVFKPSAAAPFELFAERWPIRGIDRGRDLEALTSVVGSRQMLAIGTEAMQANRPTDVIFFVQIERDHAVVVDTLELPYVMWNLQGEVNRGIEGLCSAGDYLLVGSEMTTTQAGERVALLGSYHRVTHNWVPMGLQLSTDVGKLAGLGCRLVDGAIHGVAIERHFGVGNLLEFDIAVPPVAATIHPRILAALYPGDGPDPNWEGIVQMTSGHTVVVSDNQSGRVAGPTHGLIIP